jgi:hypothetical protein
MADEACSIRQKRITAEIKVVLAPMRSFAHQPAMRLFQRDIVKQPRGLFEKENRKSSLACSIQIPAFGLKRPTIRQMDPAAFVIGQASVMVRAEGREPFCQRSPVDVANQRPISFQSREHIGSSAPVRDRRFQFRVHGPTGCRQGDGIRKGPTDSTSCRLVSAPALWCRRAPLVFTTMDAINQGAMMLDLGARRKMRVGDLPWPDSASPWLGENELCAIIAS